MPSHWTCSTVIVIGMMLSADDAAAGCLLTLQLTHWSVIVCLWFVTVMELRCDNGTRKLCCDVNSAVLWRASGTLRWLARPIASSPFHSETGCIMACVCWHLVRCLSDAVRLCLARDVAASPRLPDSFNVRHTARCSVTTNELTRSPPAAAAALE